MVQSNNEIPESTYQIRAAVRTVMSPAVWVLTLWQAIMLISLSILGGNEDTGPVTGFPVIFSILIFGFIYLISGLFRAFSTRTGVVSVLEAFNEGKNYFTPFIWLMLRLLVLFFLVTQILLITTGAQPGAIIKEGAKSFAFVISFLSFLFIYWLPIVFSTPDFRLFKTLNAALIVAVDRLKQSLFLAVLILLPALIAWMMPVDIPLAALVSIASISEIATWIAYVYCIEYLIREKKQIHALLGIKLQSKDAGKQDDTNTDDDKKD